MAANSPVSDDATLQPLILDILRTQYCVSGSVFLLEGAEELAPTSSGRWKAIRLLLSDGQLCIQALLGADLHGFFTSSEIPPGSYLKLDSFSLCSRNVANSSQRLVYLAIEHITVVGFRQGYPRDEVTNAVWPREKAAASNRAREPPTGNQPLAVPAGREGGTAEDTDDSDDGFDAPTLSKRLPQPRDGPSTVASSAKPVALPRDWKHTSTPLKLTELSQIPHLPYKQNWSVNVLAVVASISDVEASALPPYHQREVRLADASTDKRVHLTVFLDPAEFCPQQGSIVLLAGVKNHRFDGGSLKKYVSDRPKNGLSWWYEKPQFPWCPTAKLQDWWAATTTTAVPEIAAQIEDG